MSLLRPKKKERPKASASVIVDKDGSTFIDNHFRDLGVEQGWLIPTGYYVDDGRMVWTYEMKNQRY